MMSAMQPVEDINETSDEGGSDEETKTGTPSKELDGSALGAVKYDDNYIDESLYASVSVQAVEPSKSGILGLQETSYLKERSVSPVEAVDEEQPPDSQPKRAKPSKYSQHAGVEKKNPKKHNKVRYLGAEDRKTARMKEYRPREKKKEVTINSNPKTRTKAKKKKKKTRAS